MKILLFKYNMYTEIFDICVDNEVFAPINKLA